MTDLYEHDRREGSARWDAHVRSEPQPPVDPLPDFVKRVVMGTVSDFD